MAATFDGSHSIWLVPEAPFATAFRREINGFADSRNVPSFTPHVTVLGDVSGSAERSLVACDECLAGMGPISTCVKQVANTDAFFMSLFLDLTLEPSIARQHLKLAERLDCNIPNAHQPHLSLAYGWADGPLRRRETERLNDEYSGKVFRLTHLVVAHSAKSIPIEEWEEIGRIEL